MAKLTDQFIEPSECWHGDPCYVLNDVWDEICACLAEAEAEAEAEKNNALKMINEFTLLLDDGRIVTMSNTAYGDGTYFDNENNKYHVDSGLLCAIKASDIDKTNPENELHLGKVCLQSLPFKAKYDDGFITFGSVGISTGC